MKKIILALFLVFCISSAAFAQELPNLVGTWDGKTSVHHRIQGFKPYWPEKVNMIVDAQDGRFFYGYFQRTKTDGSVSKYGFSGVVMKSNRQALITWHDTDGLTLMEIEGPERVTNYAAIHDRAHAFVSMTEYKKVK